jgi:hypothetical protein
MKINYYNIDGELCSIGTNIPQLFFKSFSITMNPKFQGIDDISTLLNIKIGYYAAMQSKKFFAFKKNRPLNLGRLFFLCS